MNSKAWDILLDEEKAALSLSIHHSKSTWQAGEILNKAHYKYLEIHARAKQFFAMFTTYFQKTGDRLIPENSEIRWDHAEFITSIIEERLGYRDTIKKIGSQSLLSSKVAVRRDEELVKMMDWLRTHPQPLHRELHDLIKEFDRWNNFRVLPEILQEPSAYKRRNKTRLMKHLKNLYTLDPFLIDYLHSSKFKVKKGSKGYFLPIITEKENKGYEVLEINKSEHVFHYLSKELKLYIFDTRDDADDYAHLVESYMHAQGKRTCKTGQNFWPRFRLITQKATNYLDINNIIPRRTNLEQAFRDLDKIQIAKKDAKSKNINGSEDRLNSSQLWDI